MNALDQAQESARLFFRAAYWQAASQNPESRIARALAFQYQARAASLYAAIRALRLAEDQAKGVA